MSLSGGPGPLGKVEGSPLSAGRKRGAGGAPAHPILKDIGEIYSRLLDHRPVIQGEIRYFVKEFEEKRGLREVRVLENLKNMICETNDQTLPKCEQVMHDNLNEAFKRLQAANHRIHRLQQREQEERKELKAIFSGDHTSTAKRPMDTFTGLEAADTRLNPDEEVVDEEVELEGDAEQETPCHLLTWGARTSS